MHGFHLQGIPFSVKNKDVCYDWTSLRGIGLFEKNYSSLVLTFVCYVQVEGQEIDRQTVLPWVLLVAMTGHQLHSELSSSVETTKKNSCVTWVSLIFLLIMWLLFDNFACKSALSWQNPKYARTIRHKWGQKSKQILNKIYKIYIERRRPRWLQKWGLVWSMTFLTICDSKMKSALRGSGVGWSDSWSSWSCWERFSIKWRRYPLVDRKANQSPRLSIPMMVSRTDRASIYNNIDNKPFTSKIWFFLYSSLYTMSKSASNIIKITWKWYFVKQSFCH